VLFKELPDIVNRFLMPPDPIILRYTIDPGVPTTERPTAWDVNIKLDDLSLKNRMKNATLDANPTTVKKLGELDDEVRCL
jgi:SWI/SNF-related matrix-associated actin-dependent regulator of chromatin subfamily D